MNILSVSQYYPPHVGGVEVVARAHATCLVAAGHTVTVHTFALHGTAPGVAEEGGVAVYRVRGWHGFERWFGIPFCLGGFGAIRTLAQLVRGADVVHLHDVLYPLSWLTYLMARWYGRPLILVQHVAFVVHRVRIVEWVERFVYATWGRALLRAASAVIVFHANVREFVRGLGVPASRIRELRNGVDLTVFHPDPGVDVATIRRSFRLPTDRPLALFVGRFVPKKGCRELYEARDPAYDLVFVGSGSLPGVWAETPGVHVLGALNRTQLAELYRAVDVFVLPARGEIFTLAMQEAMASGLPVVTTRDPAYRSYGLDTHHMLLVEPNAPALRSALSTVCGDAALRARMGAYSLAWAQERFDVHVNDAALRELYTRVAAVTRTIVTTSWDDGHTLDRKLASLLAQYGIRGTFYIAPYDHEILPHDRLTDDNLRALAEEGFEVGAHTLTHRLLPTLSPDEARGEIVGSREHLERVLGAPITSFCYPAGKYQRKHVALVEGAGYTYARSVRRFSLRVGDPLEARTSIHTYDHWLDALKLMWFVRGNPRAFLRLYRRWDRQAIALFDRVRARGGVFHLWGHSDEVDRHGDWGRLERVLAHIAHHADVAYVTNRDTVL